MRHEATSPALVFGCTILVVLVNPSPSLHFAVPADEVVATYLQAGAHPPFPLCSQVGRVAQGAVRVHSRGLSDADFDHGGLGATRGDAEGPPAEVRRVFL